jgi:hypothetical protein
VGVFDEGPREDGRPPQPKESAYGYLNRSARPEADQARGLIDDWLARYPADRAGQLVLRLQSPLGQQHEAAFFELLLHQMLLSLGHRVAAIEPKLPHTWKSPDFLVESGAGESFYLEGVSAGGADLRDVLKRKVNRYGALGLPYVVAVNKAGSEDLSPLLMGNGDSLWHGPRGPQRQRLSAVLALEHADPWRFAECRVGLIRNPWAEIPLPPVDLGDGRRVGGLVQL